MLEKIGGNPYLFDFLQRLCNLGDLRRHVSSHLDAMPGESILDVGCGTGLYSTLAKGTYVGVDLNEQYIKYAQSHYPDGQKTFIVGDITKLGLDGQMFDKTLYLAVLHHFCEEDNLNILRNIAAVTRKMAVILDLTYPEKPTFMQRFFLAVERGEYVRPLKEQIRIIEQVFRVGDVSTVLNNSRFGLFSIIDCFPKGCS
ncbi:MAG: class I SAM-dependent methyltransferase [Candidatus Omnitrophota bacterium]